VVIAHPSLHARLQQSLVDPMGDQGAPMTSKQPPLTHPGGPLVRRPTVGGLNVGTDHQILHSPRHQHLAAACQWHDARGDVYIDPCDPSVPELDHSTVQSDPNLDPERSDDQCDLRGASDRASRALEPDLGHPAGLIWTNCVLVR
jgi:hypothetical protein